MKKFAVWILAGALLIGITLSGCGGSPEVQSTTKTTTLGQELMDLEKAHKQGVITEKEYNAAKEKLLKEK